MLFSIALTLPNMDVPVRLFPRPSRYVNTRFGDVSGRTFSLGPRDPKRGDRDENRGLGTRQDPMKDPNKSWQSSTGGIISKI